MIAIESEPTSVVGTKRRGNVMPVAMPYSPSAWLVEYPAFSSMRGMMIAMRGCIMLTAKRTAVIGVALFVISLYVLLGFLSRPP